MFSNDFLICYAGQNFTKNASKYVTLEHEFTSKAEAMKALKKVNKKYPGRIIPESLKGGKTKWRIQVGPLSQGSQKALSHTDNTALLEAS